SGFSSAWPAPGTTRTPCGSRCCPASRTAPMAGRRWTRSSAMISARGCMWNRSGRATRTSPGTTGTPPSSGRTWSRRCGGTTACAFDAGWKQARVYSHGYHPTPAELAELWSAITRRDGAAFAHNAAGFVAEHRRHADRWDLAAIARELDGTVALYVGGSDEDP